MSNSYSIEETDDMVIVRFSHLATLDNIIEANIAVAENCKGKKRLWDISLAPIDFSTSDLQRVANIARNKFKLSTKVAIIAPKDISFGIARQYEAYRDDGIIKLKIFRTEQEALEWL